MESNPLSQYFRQPSIYIRLPSQGRFYPPGALKTTPNNEYPVLPMTTIDEITYRTPDALFNGQAVVSVIQSCIPNIIDAWHMPTVDMDTILIAIRIATYGHELDVTTTCPSCSHESDYAVDLRTTLGQIGHPDYNQGLKLGDLEISFGPMTYAQMNENNLAQFEEQKVMRIMEDPSIPATDKANQLGEILKKITGITVRALSQNITTVKSPQAMVTDPHHIEEWLSNCDRKTFAVIRDHILKMRESTEIPPLKLKCSECQHEYEQIFTLDMSTFFEDAS